MLNRILGEDIDVEFHYAPRPAYVRADLGMIEQVVLNLVVNARDAMPFGGHLSIETALVEGAAKFSGPVSSMGSWVCLRVTDTGSGIAPEHLPHIFEPFFTTKDVGKGTGLGLATTYGIAQQHGGWIEVDSEVDRGTTFSAFFPQVSAAVAEAPPPAATRPAPRGHETILVVEDEDGVRALVIKVLEKPRLSSATGAEWTACARCVARAGVDDRSPDHRRRDARRDERSRAGRAPAAHATVVESDFYQRVPGRCEPRRFPGTRDRCVSREAVQPAGAGQAGATDARRARADGGPRGGSLTPSRGTRAAARCRTK
jgi:hypothetical protein